MRVGNSGIYNTPAPWGRQAACAAQRPPQAMHTAENRDRLQICRTANEKAATNAAFAEFLSQLQQAYPDVRIITETSAADAERDILAEALQSHEDGYLLIISKEFMESLHAGKESYERKTNALLACIKKLVAYREPTGLWLEDDRAVFWQTAPNRPAAAGQTPAQPAALQVSQMLPSAPKRNEPKVKLGTASPYRTAASYARMAQARNKAAVQTVMQQTQRDIALLKLMSVYAGDKDRQKAKAAIRSLQKLLLRGNKKIAKFNDEQMTQLRMKRAHKKAQQEKELQAALELKRQKKSRAVFDGVIRKEGQLEQLNGRPLYHKHKWLTERDTAAKILPLPSFCPTSAPLPAAAEFSAAEVTVTEVINI